MRLHASEFVKLSITHVPVTKIQTGAAKMIQFRLCVCFISLIIAEFINIRFISFVCVSIRCILG